MSIQPVSPILRKARPEDAPDISRLYQEAYRPAEGGDPRKCYPFPQFLEPDGVEEIIKGGMIRWFVAELDNHVIGTMGAVTNIGNPDDRVVECFGLVIDKNWQFHGIGTALFKCLLDSLTSTGDAVFVIAETRTSHPGGWKAAKHCDFIPLGLEPYAHVTPAGSETMLLTGKIAPDALAKRKPDGFTSARVLDLSIPVLKELNCQPLTLQQGVATYPLSENLSADPFDWLEDGILFAMPQARLKPGHVEIYEDEAAQELPATLKNLARHKAGVISLQRLEGKDSQGVRYRRRFFLAYLDKQPIAYALAVWDGLDRRLRILDLRSMLDGVQGLLIQHILRIAEGEIADRPLTVVLDVSADNVKLHATLQKLGCFPTVYYPALIAVGEFRADAVQFTRLFNLNYRESLVNAKLMEWTSANALASRISAK
ncbi:MAG: GNAT family protein [Proteobacteria bacterium]|nr:GNAT family protein [Pseudomonadota bacterium]